MLYYNVITIEIRCTINVMRLNHPETLPRSITVHGNPSLVPKRLGSAAPGGLGLWWGWEEGWELGEVLAVGVENRLGTAAGWQAEPGVPPTAHFPAAGYGRVSVGALWRRGSDWSYQQGSVEEAGES